MAAIDKAWCGECFYTAAELAASSPMFPCDANKGKHVMVVPVSAIAAALDGLDQADPPMLDPLDRERRDTISDVRLALLGEEEIYNDK